MSYMLILNCLLFIDRLSFVVFFFKQKTAYEMRISDWSSDVCSSDLATTRVRRRTRVVAGAGRHQRRGHSQPGCVPEAAGSRGHRPDAHDHPDRKSVV